jgi:hypothetical protein
MAPSGAEANAFGASNFCLTASPLEHPVWVQLRSLGSPVPITVVTTCIHDANIKSFKIQISHLTGFFSNIYLWLVFEVNRISVAFLQNSRMEIVLMLNMEIPASDIC